MHIDLSMCGKIRDVLYRRCSSSKVPLSSQDSVIDPRGKDRSGSVIKDRRNRAVSTVGLK